MNYREADRRDALARAYVLGTMSRRARRRFGDLFDAEPDIEQAVLNLEAQLAPLAESLPPITPSALVWPRIARRLAMSSHANRPAAPTRTPWRLAVGALALGLIAMTAAWWQASRTTPPVIDVRNELPATGVIANDKGIALWYVQLTGAEARVRVATTPPVTSDRVYELWVLRNDGVPVSIGILPQAGSATLSLSDAANHGLANGSTLAVSLEPPGGSPEPTPSGPVLFTTPILRL